MTADWTATLVGGHTLHVGCEEQTVVIAVTWRGNKQETYYVRLYRNGRCELLTNEKAYDAYQLARKHAHIYIATTDKSNRVVDREMEKFFQKATNDWGKKVLFLKNKRRLINAVECFCATPKELLALNNFLNGQLREKMTNNGGVERPDENDLNHFMSEEITNDNLAGFWEDAV